MKLSTGRHVACGRKGSRQDPFQGREGDGVERTSREMCGQQSAFLMPGYSSRDALSAGMERSVVIELNWGREEQAGESRPGVVETSEPP